MTNVPDPRPKVLVKANVGKVAGVSAAAIAIMVAFTAPYEGQSLVAYVDELGRGKPITWCYGETSGDVKLGDRFTPDECRAALERSAYKHAKAISPCLPTDLPDKTAAAFYDFGYNVGAATFCKSSISRKAKAGDLIGACKAIGLYVYTSGKDCRIKANRCGGIIRRRNDEIRLCLEGLK